MAIDSSLHYTEYSARFADQLYSFKPNNAHPDHFALLLHSLIADTETNERPAAIWSLGSLPGWVSRNNKLWIHNNRGDISLFLCVCVHTSCSLKPKKKQTLKHNEAFVPWCSDVWPISFLFLTSLSPVSKKSFQNKNLKSFAEMVCIFIVSKVSVERMVTEQR